MGAGIGAHLEFEPLDRQEYHCIELRGTMADDLRRKYPSVVSVTGDCQQRIPYDDGYLDRVLAIHVLEHLPNLPAAIDEIDRVLMPGGLVSVVLPCDPGLAYELARKVSAERVFKAKYKMPYGGLFDGSTSTRRRRSCTRSRGSSRSSTIVYFPLAVPVINLNLCIGVTARKPPPRRTDDLGVDGAHPIARLGLRMPELTR